jgi:hypothetical protein
MLGQIRLKIAGRKFHMEFKKKKNLGKTWSHIKYVGIFPEENLIRKININN